KIGALCPLDETFTREFAQGLKTIIVVEEKRDFLERQVGRAVCEMGPIKILGKYDRQGEPLFPQEGGMHSDMVVELLGRVLEAEAPLTERAGSRFTQVQEIARLSFGAQPRRTLN